MSPLSLAQSPDSYAIGRGGRSFGKPTAWIGPAISAGVLLAALFQLRSIDLPGLVGLLPATPLFWLALGGAYAALPVSEWLIYRRLCGLPARAIVPLLRKRISNEILLGYSGELYFYAWMRRHASADAPLGIIKDVSILSAQAGNAATLLMLAVAWPSLGAVRLGTHAEMLLLSAAAVIALSLPIVLFRRRLFHLGARPCAEVALLHLARIAASLALTAVAWHEALPAVGLGLWLALIAVRQILSRLPLMPNKDIVFAGLVAFLIGPQAPVAGVIAMTASLIMATHILLGIVMAGLDLAGLSDPSRREAS